ncbi:MAG: choice-of-anchor D domain-containing protein [Candidatus Kapabacteria bacterium]|nr:choice-of-anchor D domain-containing protein [Candidatus Kapabacteria bacterium]
MDNTIARAPFSVYYNVWTHIAAVFDGTAQQALLYINGTPVAQHRNMAYPANRLHTLQTPTLLMQLGSTNALGNVGERNTTFRGYMDEVRLWSRALSPRDIACGQYTSLQGTEPSLVLYYRCNDPIGSVRLCDATPNNTQADLRGARITIPTQARNIPQFLSVQPERVSDVFQCDRTRRYPIRIRNTSAGCVEHIVLSLVGTSAGAFEITPRQLTLSPEAETTATLTLTTQLTGTIQAAVSIARQNSCGDTLIIPITIQRTTVLAASPPSVTFGTLYAGCRETPFLERQLSLRNTSSQPLQLLGFRQQRAGMFRIVGTLQQTLAPGAAVQIPIRFFATDTAQIYRDTLFIRTNDTCQPELALPLSGTIEEAVIVRRGYGLARLDSVQFGRECPQTGISDPIEFTWESTVRGANIQIDTVIAPRFVRVRSVRYPVLLRSGVLAEPSFLRFAPLREGIVRDSVIIRSRIVGSTVAQCTFETIIHVSGIGSATNVLLNPSRLNFGTVVIGQQGNASMQVTNPSTQDTLQLLALLRRGEHFFLSAGRSFTLAPRASITIPVDFRPSADSTYTDELCIIEQQCFATTCATLLGQGMRGIFQFDSAVMRLDGVLGCTSRIDTLTITNISDTDQTLTNISFTDQSGGRIQILSGLNNPAIVSVVIRRGEKLVITFRYTPNDTTQDRTDAAFLRFRAGNQDWTLNIRATSIVPKLFVTPLTAFGVVEIGDRRLDTITVENISPVEVELTTLALPSGYTLHWSEYTIPRRLRPRERVRFGVTFSPQEDRRYNGIVTVSSLSPCLARTTGRFEGRGSRAEIEIGANPVNVGFTRPCDCRTAQTTLYNTSFAHTFTIESITIGASEPDSAFSRPELFSWISRFSPRGTVPYNLPPQEIDTLTIRFCPRSPATPQHVLNAATMRITARSPVRRQEFSIDLTGRRTLVMLPTPRILTFAPTLVNTDATPLMFALGIPTSTSQNPSPQPVVVDSIGFMSTDGISNSISAFRILSPARPIVLQPNQPPVSIQLGFRPTEARPYAARLVLYQSQPCLDIDTTILISGIGFVGALGLPFRFNSTEFRLDTFRLTTCGTVTIPIFSARNDVTDTLSIRLHLLFDTTRLSVLRVSSDIVPTERIIARSTAEGIEVQLSNVRLDSLRAVLRIELASRTQRRAVFPIRVDSIDIRRTQGGTFQLIPAGTFAYVVVEETRIAIAPASVPTVQFDSVQVLACSRRTLSVRNVGDRAVQALSLVHIPRDVRIVSSSPALSDTIQVGASLAITLEYCPRSEQRIDTTLSIRTAVPCPSITHATIAGRGFRPELPLIFSFTTATLRGTIGDTVVLPLRINRDIAVRIDTTQYWLRNFRFTVNLAYSPYSLKFLSAETPLRGGVLRAQNTFPQNASMRGLLTISFSSLDSVRAGTIALLRFIVAVPDTLITPLFINADSTSFQTDSLMFVKIRTIPTTATWTTDGICNLTFLPRTASSAGGNLATRTPLSVLKTYPNPASERVILEFDIHDAQPVALAIYDYTGNLVQMLLKGQTLVPGHYIIELATHTLPQGTYWWRMRTQATPSQTLVQPFVIIR